MNDSCVRALRTISALVICLAALLVVAGGTQADGMLIPGPWPPDRDAVMPRIDFTVKYHHVDVTIEGQMARTHIDQVFKSDYGRDMEATYIFPIPEGAAIQEFALWMGREKVAGTVLDADEARRIYEEIVRHRRDPALLEYFGRGLFKARVFPVPAHGEARIELEYTELLSQVNNTVRYTYPLDTERFSARPIESVRIAVDIHSTIPVRSVYSPSHDLSIRRPDDHSATVTYEETDTRPDTDLALYYDLSDDDIGLSLLTFAPRREDGYFILLASPRVEIQDEEVEAKDVVFVFDRTGSMQGEKIKQAREALRFCLNTLNLGDRFNLIPFNEAPDPVFSGLVQASEENLDRALRVAGSLDAVGGTDIDEALTAALPMLRGSEGPCYVLFMTDGLPTVGTTDIAEILADARDAATPKARLFAFGVGYDVNTMLLDKLALQHKGSADYVRPGEDIEVKVSNLFRMISYPVLTNVDIDYGSMDAYDVFPKDMPDLYKGSQIMLVGRFRGRGWARVSLRGEVQGRAQTFELSQSLDESSRLDDFIPPIWAQRKIGYLIEQIRLHGQDRELIDEIVRLSKEYGVITEYTSFLVEEPRILVRRDFQVQATRLLAQGMDEALAKDTGGWAVNQSVNLKKASGAASAPKSTQTYFDADGEEVSIASVRNVQNRAFFQQGTNWVQSGYLEDQEVLRVKALSRAQFQLLERDPSLGEVMALGSEVLFLVNGRAVQIGPSGAEELSESDLRRLFGT